VSDSEAFILLSLYSPVGRVVLHHSGYVAAEVSKSYSLLQEKKFNMAAFGNTFGVVQSFDIGGPCLRGDVAFPRPCRPAIGQSSGLIQDVPLGQLLRTELELKLAPGQNEVALDKRDKYDIIGNDFRFTAFAGGESLRRRCHVEEFRKDIK
jgi:hypothetical protein